MRVAKLSPFTACMYISKHTVNAKAYVSKTSRMYG